MVDAISNWIKGVLPPGQSKSKSTVLSNKNAAAIDKWRSLQYSSPVSLFEETCGPQLEAKGYILIS